jgi:hypothetical protein
MTGWRPVDGVLNTHVHAHLVKRIEYHIAMHLALFCQQIAFVNADWIGSFV